MNEFLNQVRSWWNREVEAGRKRLWLIVGSICFGLLLFAMMPQWLKSLLIFVGVPVAIVVVVRRVRRRNMRAATQAAGLSLETWSGTDEKTAEVVGMLAVPRIINWHLYKAGLYVNERPVGFRAVQSKTPETLTATAFELYRMRSRPGHYTVNGEHLTMPRLVQVSRTPVGPVAFFTAIPGATEQMYARGAEALKTSMKVQGLRIEQLPDDLAAGVMRFTFITNDPLTERVRGDFFTACPAQSPLSIPLGVTEMGGVYSLPLHHTLIVGATGSGKGSPLHGIIRQLAPWRERGLARLWGGDIKRSEFKGFEQTSLFEEVHFDADGQADMLNRLVDDVLRAKQAQSGRSFQLSPENPLDVILIDEFSSLMREPGFKPGLVALNTLMSQGRSDGVYVIAASQEAQKAILDNYRQHFANRIALRVEQPLEVDMVLGAGALEQGAAPHLIAPANEANGYATAGIGYVKSDGSPRPDRIRFAYTSDDDIAELFTRFPRAQDQPISWSS